MKLLPALFAPVRLATILFVFFCLVSLPAQDSTLIKSVHSLVDQSWDLSMMGSDSAIILAEQALKLATENGYIFGEILARESIGLYHEMITGNIDLASKQYYEAIHLCEARQFDYTSSLYHTLGVMFHTTDNYNKAKHYYSLSLEKATKQGDSILIKKCLTNLGSVHSSLNEYNAAEEYMKKSLEIRSQPEMDYTTYGNLGYLYVKQNKFSQAIPVLYKATEINPDNPDPDLNLYFLLHAKTMAKDSSNMKKALARAKQAAATDQYGLRDKSLLFRNIADYLAFTQDFMGALEYRDKYIQVYEEIKENQRDQIVLELETKYATEKKDAQLQVLKLESEKKAQQTRFYSYLALAGILTSGMIGFLFYKNREKNKILVIQKQQLEANVEEINLLLREIHHRVKNNLQVITSLLNIQQRSISDENAIEAIIESKNRIKSMGLIHQSFYENRNLGQINTQQYIQNLIHQLVENYKVGDQSIDIETNIQGIYLDMDTLVPLGLIINEMVSNSLKHAFKQKQNGTLSLRLEKIDDTYELEVSDNGSGLNDFDELRKSKSFGFSMIEAFVKKLKGSLHLQETGGTTFLIQFQHEPSV